MFLVVKNKNYGAPLFSHQCREENVYIIQLTSSTCTHKHQLTSQILITNGWWLKNEL